MRSTVVIVLLFVFYLGCTETTSSARYFVSKSQQLLLNVKRGTPSDTLKKELESISGTQLSQGLNTDQARLAFWLNVYNAYFQELGKSDSTVDLTIFKKPLIEIADTTFSFDDIEHGILRNQPGYNFSDLAVEHIDSRIHFALNCGAKSCPPIAFYDFENLDVQLEQAAKWFINQNTEIDELRKEVKVSEIFDWFREDFGGDDEAILKYVGSYLNRDLRSYKLEFSEWDWTAQFDNYL